jgi:hypothetical protein
MGVAMTYSCTDFTDAVLEALGVDVPQESEDSPSDQADLALAEIERLKRIEAATSERLRSQTIGERDLEYYETCVENHETALRRCGPAEEPENKLLIAAAGVVVVALRLYGKLTGAIR